MPEKTLKFLFFSLICTLVLTFAATAQEANTRQIEGRVVDIAGLPVSGAEIVVSGKGRMSICKTDNQGYFKCDLNQAEGSFITIRAEGFSILRHIDVNIQDSNAIREYKLTPEALREDVVVNTLKAKTSISEAPASIDLIERDELTNSAGVVIDDVLRNSVGFGLFRRSGSLTANPTTQGASLRGISSSGASRSQVLFDGLALNDPFGGWIVWNKVPKIATERIEILRGGSSALFGSGSLGGTVNLIPRSTANNNLVFAVEASAGTANSFDGSFFTGFERKGWSVDGFASTSQTKGYRIIEKIRRGPVDDFANSRNSVFSIRLARKLGKEGQVFGRAAVFGEGRNNGTPAQKNRTHIRDFSVGTEIGFGEFDANLKDTRLSARAFGSTQVFDQTFSSVADDRAGETLVRLQRVPAQKTGLILQLFSLIDRHSLVFGFEGTEVRGSSNETGYFGGSATSQVGAGGRERKYGFFVQDFVRVSEKFTLAAAVRFESWKNYRSLSSVRTLSTNNVSTETFADRDESSVAPSLSIAYRLTESFGLYALAGKSFRAPTLNELYRGFRVGSVITNPNSELKAENAWNYEAGARFSSGPFYLQGSFFLTKISNAISNVTLDPGPPLILRQRRNAGKTKTKGLEFEIEYRRNRVNIGVGFLGTDATVKEFDLEPGLVGKRVPQIPARQLTTKIELRPDETWTLSFQGRASSGQYDDDLNTFLLESYFQGDVSVSKRVRENSSLFFAIQNIFNSRYSIGRTPIRTISGPFSFRAGFRWN